MIPKHSRRKFYLAPDQLFSAGYRDGTNRRAPHSQFQNNHHYLKGYAEGCRSLPDEPTLVAFSKSESLDTALQSLHCWEQDQTHFGFGTVALSYVEAQWIVLVSKDLHDAALPF
jgi:hypothetical protein